MGLDHFIRIVMSQEPIPYYPISRFYKERFGTKVYKISVAVADTCPNREGLKGMQTCNFCDQWGSAAYSQNLEKPLRAQIEEMREVIARKRNVSKFLIYFQAYTTTFGKVSQLREQVEIALSYPDVLGVVIGTRPDCVSLAFLEMCREYSEKTFVAVEMGLQSFDNKILEWMRRGHTAEASEAALVKIAKYAPKVNLGVHLIFGAPGETDEMAVEAAKRVNALPVQNVKLHHLHVLRETELEKQFNGGEFVPMEQAAYFQRCTLFLQHLRNDIAVHRLSALSSRWDELVAPAWSSYKMETYQAMLDFMRKSQAYQGQHV
jgi:radical SAM protein (TIGR01212 family)